jgi:hypothetical protein
VIAVVDHHIKQRIMVGPAAPSSRPGSLVHDDACPASGKTHGRREPGKSGANDVDGARHQMTA